MISAVGPLTINFLITLSLIKVCTFVQLSPLYPLMSFLRRLALHLPPSLFYNPLIRNFIVFCPGNWPECEDASGFRLLSGFFFFHHRFIKLRKELPDIVYHISDPLPCFFFFLQLRFFEDKIMISPPFPAHPQFLKACTCKTCRYSLC